MALSAMLLRITAKTSTGNQAYTGAGFQPKAVVFIATAQTAAGLTTSGDRVMIMRGMTDGTNDGCAGISYSVADEADGISFAHDNRCIAFWQDSGSTPALIAAASIVSLDADGFTLNWDTADGSAWVIDALCLGGDSITDQLVATGTLSGTSHAMTTAGFTPACGIFAAINRGTTFNTNTATGGFAVGHGVSGTERHGAGVRCRNNNNAHKIWQTDALLPFVAGGAQEDTWDLDGFDSAGFDLTKDVDSGNGGLYACLLLAGVDAALQTLTQPTSTGAQSLTGESFEPTAVLTLSADTTDESAAATSEIVMGMAAADTAEGGSWFGITAPGTPLGGMSNATDRTIVSRAPADGAIEADAVFTSFNSDGVTFTWQTADATQRLHGVMMLGPAAGGGGGGGTVPVFMDHYRRRRVA